MPRQTADTHDDAPHGDATTEATDLHVNRVSRNSKFSCEIVLNSLRANFIQPTVAVRIPFIAIQSGIVLPILVGTMRKAVHTLS